MTCDYNKLLCGATVMVSGGGVGGGGEGVVLWKGMM